MRTIIHRADSRGHVNHGWLDSWHTFSFANYYNPDRMNFGALRVLNDDTVAPGKGFGKHPHNNMEIISIPLSGDLEHEDSMGNKGIIREGDIQVMSAGTGVSHSERNKNHNREVKFLQIWIFPNKQNVEPRYDQVSLKKIALENEFYQMLSPHKEGQGVWIYQDAWFYLGNFTEEWQGKYDLKNQEHGVYFFILEGEAKIGGQKLNKRDGLGVWDTNSIQLSVGKGSQILLMEVSMQK